MTERRVYRGTAERDGAYWLIRVPAVDRVTQAKRLDQAEAMARELIAIMTDEDPESFDVDIQPRLDPDVSGFVVRAAAASGRARVHQLEASNAIREAAQALHRSGLPLRDVGQLLGVSYQRVQQLLADETSAAELRDRLDAERVRLGEPGTQVAKVGGAAA